MDAEISIAEKHHVHFSRSDELPRKDRRRVAAEDDLDVGRRAAHRLGDLEPSVERVPPFACNSDIPRPFVLEDRRDIVVEQWRPTAFGRWPRLPPDGGWMQATASPCRARDRRLVWSAAD